MINKPLHILIIEDNKTDALLMERQVRKLVTPLKVTHISQYTELAMVLVEDKPDMILCDYNLTSWTGLEALKYVQEVGPSIPFIFVTGQINDEELAANTILTGASGYILKKDMERLNEKLLPFFQKLVTDREEISLQAEDVGSIQLFLDHVEQMNRQSKIIRSELERLKKFLDKYKAGKNG